MHTNEQWGPQELPADVRAALDRGQMLEAIQRLRSARNVDLKQATELIRAHARNRVPVRSTGLESMIREDRTNAWFAVIVLLAAVGLVAYWLLR
jgi:hypothetical protein